MSTQVASAWHLEVERGPDWLFLKLHGPGNGDAEGTPLAEMIWHVLEQHFTYRVVIDLSQLHILRSVVIGQLVQLHKRVYTSGGLMRLVGLSDENYGVLVACRLHERFPQYATAEEAVMGYRPAKPR